MCLDFPSERGATHVTGPRSWKGQRLVSSCQKARVRTIEMSSRHVAFDGGSY